MKLTYDPFPLIFSQGDTATQLACLQFFDLQDTPRANRCLLQLVKQQRADGTFPSRLDPRKWGMRETVRNAILLQGMGFPSKGANVDSAVRFILSHQSPDGGWMENGSLDIPPEVVELSNERSITWLTADVVDLLRQAGLRRCQECKAALDWLRRAQNRYGGWSMFAGDVADRPDATGDPDSSAQITFLMGEIYGEHDPIYLQGRDLFESNLDLCAQDAERGYRIRSQDGQKEELDGYTLTHLLLSSLFDPPRRFQAGYDVGDPRVQCMMEALLDSQQEDGGWRPFWTEESSPIYTALAVKTLILSGVLAQADLQRGVEAYAA